MALFLLLLFSSARADDMEALKSFFDGLDEASQQLLKVQGWDFSTNADGNYNSPVCGKLTLGWYSSWSPQNIICSKQFNALISIKLSQEGLRGSLPASFGQLHSLKRLDLSKNILEGTFPSELATLGKLTFLDLSQNKFVGAVPPSIGQLTSLIYFIMKGNQIVSLPSELGNLASIQDISFGANLISGTIHSSFGQLRALTSFDLSVNSLHGTIPTERGLLSRLEILLLGKNSLTGTIPETVAGISSLSVLQLEQNLLTGNLPKTIQGLSNLRVLWVGNNSLHGPAPSEQSKPFPSSLQAMDLSNNSFTSLNLACLFNANSINARNNKIRQKLEIDPSVFGCNLIMLDLSNNLYTGPVPSEVGKLSSLQYLFLSGNTLDGMLPTELGSATRLVDFAIADNSIVGSLPTQLGALYALRSFNVSGNKMTGQLPPQLFANKSSLAMLVLSDNAFSGDVPSPIYLPSLRTLKLDGNTLKSFPSDATALYLPSLRLLDIGFNLIAGSVAGAWFSASPLLETFIATQNCLSNALPASEMCGATNLRNVILDGLSAACPGSVSLSGAVFINAATTAASAAFPACLLTLPNIQVIHASGNALKGRLDLPDGATLSPELVDLSLTFNRIGGAIPPSLQAAASQFRTLDLSYNRLNGTLAFMSTPQPSAYFNLGVNRLSGYLSQALLGLQAPPPKPTPTLNGSSALAFFSLWKGTTSTAIP